MEMDPTALHAAAAAAATASPHAFLPSSQNVDDEAIDIDDAADDAAAAAAAAADDAAAALPAALPSVQPEAVLPGRPFTLSTLACFVLPRGVFLD